MSDPGTAIRQERRGQLHPYQLLGSRFFSAHGPLARFVRQFVGYTLFALSLEIFRWNLAICTMSTTHIDIGGQWSSLLGMCVIFLLMLCCHI